MKYEITIYTKFGVRCYDMEEENDDTIRKYFESVINHQRYREKITIINKKTNKIQQLKNF